MIFSTFAQIFAVLDIKNKFIQFLSTVFPANRTEWALFAVFLSVYGTLGTVIALDYRIIFDDRIPWDAYFSFDNRAIVLTGGGYERHPLANYFFKWLREFALMFSGGQKNEIFRLVLAWCSNFAISLSLIQIFKYLKNIIGLPNRFSLLTVIFFSAFSTNILLSFTPETYTYTLFLLVLFNYYAALKIRKDEVIPASALTLAAVGIGGLTVTNVVKVYIPLLFQRKIFSNWKNLGKAALSVVISIAVFLLLFMYRMDFKFMQFLDKSGAQFEKFSQQKVTPYWDMMASWFLGGNILFAGFELRDYHNKKGFEYKALFMDVFDNWVSYAVITAIIILLIWSWLKNLKNKLANILMLSLLVDVVIHGILRFGLHTSYIYGGHFVFVFPLMVGWLFHAYRSSSKVITSLFIVLMIIFSYVLLNNIFRMTEFFRFLELHYR